MGITHLTAWLYLTIHPDGAVECKAKVTDNNKVMSGSGTCAYAREEDACRLAMPENNMIGKLAYDLSLSGEACEEYELRYDGVSHTLRLVIPTPGHEGSPTYTFELTRVGEVAGEVADEVAEEAAMLPCVRDGAVQLAFWADLTVSCSVTRDGVTRVGKGQYIPPAADGSTAGTMFFLGTDVLALEREGTLATAPDAPADEASASYALLLSDGESERPTLTVVCPDGFRYAFSLAL